MRILIDQTLGIPITSNRDVIVRKTPLKKDRNLEEIIIKKENSVLKTRLPIVKRTIQEELDQIGTLLKKHGRILYIYDGKMTDKEVLDRMRNWYLPDYTLQILDGSIHRAYALYLIKLKEEGQSLATSLPPEQGILISNFSKFTVSNYQKVGRKTKKKCFIHSKEQQKNKKREEHTILLERLMESYPAVRFIAVGNMDIPVMANMEFYPLEKWAFPNSVNYLSIFPLPERSDGN
ncbi:hypothetical protein [Sporosarcina sp. FSL K6-1508]|uniref:hypothetical protein n=1 Tax=Sporosarcina sp. FSL K6-1508 TaxID=2921553 RepID=UPI0030F5A949